MTNEEKNGNLKATKSLKRRRCVERSQCKKIKNRLVGEWWLHESTFSYTDLW